MPAEKEVRKLAAIMHADVKGYSRLMGEDESYTVHSLAKCRKIFSENIRNYEGRIVNAPGDSILAEFPSVVSAVQCAVEIQEQIKARNSGLSPDRKMEFRIGINLGDVIESSDGIYGDGVNIAARIEALAEPGGVSISRTVFNHVHKKLQFGFQYHGAHKVKNIADPVRVYKLLTTPEDLGKLIGEPKLQLKSSKVWIAVGAVFFAIVTGLFLYLYPLGKKIEPALIEKMTFPLPNKPSIAVLPFANVGNDPEQEYFSDGMTDDLITDLSKISGIFVIARNSVFTYKGKPAKIQQIAEELSVRYVLEGSVRRAGEKLRVNAQLIDATTGHHLWAERYDGRIGDVFALQDKITGQIVAALAVKLTASEQKSVKRRYTDSIAAYDAFLQGRAYYVRRTPDDFARAVQYFTRATELDSNFSLAYAMLALTYWESHHNFWNQSLGVPWYRARIRAETYLQKARKNPTALFYQVESRILVGQQKHDEAIASAERAIALDPNDADSYLYMAYALIHAGKPDEAFDFINTAIRIDPNYPAYYLFVLGLAQFNIENYEDAVRSFNMALERNPVNYVPLIYLAAAYAHLDRKHEAAAAIQRLKETLPVVSVDFITHPVMSGKYKRTVDRNRLLDGFRKAGLPETPYDILYQMEKQKE